MTASAKLRFLADTVLAEAAHLQTTDGRLFDLPMTSRALARLERRVNDHCLGSSRLSRW